MSIRRLLTVVAVLPMISGATTYYVATTGSDSNSGTLASPFLTIQHAADVVNPGDTVVVEDGTYNTSTSGTGSILVAPTRSGTASAYITFQAQHKWGAVLDGRESSVCGPTCATSEGFEISASYINIRGFEIKNFDTQGISTYREIASGGGHVNMIQNHIHDIGRECTSRTDGLNAYFLGGSYNTVDQSLVHDIGRYQVGQNGCTVSDGTDAHDHGVYIGGYSGVQTQITVQNSIFYNTQSGWGVQLYGGSTSNVNIVNNSFAFPNPIQIGHIVLAENVTNALIENNISYQPNTGLIKIFSGSSFSNVAVNNNLVYQGTLGDSQSGMTFSNNQVNTDPLIVSASTPDLHLTVGSPAINTATSSGAPSYDFDGNTRPQGSGFDIGAYEYVATITLPTISSFTASPSSIFPTGSSGLAWSTSGATSVSIDQGIGIMTGLTSTSVSPSATTTYTLTAINSAGSVNKAVTVSVLPPVISSFTASPAAISSGSSSTLAWSVTGATSLSIDNGIGTVTATSVSVSPSTTTSYILTATNAAGSTTATATLTVTVSAKHVGGSLILQ